MKQKSWRVDLAQRMKQAIARQYPDTKFMVRSRTEVDRCGLSNFVSVTWTDGPEIDKVRDVVKGVVGFTAVTRQYYRDISPKQLMRYREQGVNLYSVRVVDGKGYMG